MAREIERKFKLEGFSGPDNHPDKLIGLHKIRQFYLVSSEEGVLRVREQDGVIILTAKGQGLLSREECETVLEVGEDFVSLLEKLSIGKVIQKNRYTFFDGKYEYTIDSFEGVLKGLMLMEVEFKTEEEAHEYKLPAWAEGSLEVTEDPSYANSSLSLK